MWLHIYILKSHENVYGRVGGVGLVAKSCSTIVTPWTGAHQYPLTMDSPGKNAGGGCHALLQGIFPTQGLDPCILCLLHW